jgi:hypothetical protein
LGQQGIDGVLVTEVVDANGEAEEAQLPAHGVSGATRGDQGTHWRIAYRGNRTVEPVVEDIRAKGTPDCAG